MKRETALLLSAVVAACSPAAALAGRPGDRLVSVGTLSSLHVSVNAIDTEPINGFVPQLVMGLTDESDDDSANSGVEGFGIASSTPGGNSLPYGGPPVYAVATLDTGSSGNVISYDAGQAFDLAGANLIDGGSQTTTISGANGNEDVTITNAVGVYVTDFSHASVSGGTTLSVTAGSLQGQYNVPGLVGNQGDGLPNVVGSPILAQYRATIQNSVPQHLSFGGVVYQTPKVTLGGFSTGIPTGYSKLTLKAFDSASSGPESEPTPYYINYNVLSGDPGGPTDPSTPGVWASFFTNGGVGLSRNGSSATGQTFLLDTGAQVCVISNDEAASLGIFNASPATADFTEEVQGVGGVTEVPGYYLSNLTLVTQGGVLSWNRVPVIVLDVADPRDPTSALPGILGTSLFSDRDLILNTNISGTAQSYLAIGPQIQWQTSTGGNWSNASNWAVVEPNGVDMQANFYGAIKAASTINVDAAYTVGRITFDNANRYTLSGAGSITMNDSADGAQINVRTGSHTIATPLILASDTTVTVIPTTSTLTVSGVVSSSSVNGTPGGITVSGFGTLLLTNANTYTGTTNVSTGILTITGSITSTSVSTSTGAILNATGSTNAGLSKLTVLNSGGATNIGPNTATSGPVPITLASIEVGSDPTSIVTVTASALQANRSVLVTGGLTFDSTSAGRLDLQNNDMVIHGTTLSVVAALVRSGRNLLAGTAGYWNGPGIESSTAAANTSFLTALAVIENQNAGGIALYSTTPGNALGSFDKQSTSSTDILIKYTYNGDANLDGRVDGSDYSLTDYGYIHHLSGWYNGDFNYDGVVDGSDYALLDNAYHNQGSRLATTTALVATVSAAPAAVPEPGGLMLASLSSLGFIRRGRSRR